MRRPTPDLARRERAGYRRPPVTLPGHPAPNAGKTYPAEILTPAEVLALMGACRRGPSGARNRALIVVLWRSGLRVGEVLALAPKDVDLANGTITVLHGKRDRRRTIGIDAQALAVLEQWVDARRRLGVGPGKRLFCQIAEPRVGEPVRPNYVRDLLKRLATRAGIDKRVHPHGLRHTHAFELANENTPLHLIQAQLGHQSLATTDRYVRHIAPVALVRAIQARPWPG